MAKRLVHALLIIGGLLFSALGIGFIIRGKQSNANNETSHVKSKANIVGFNDVSTRGTGGNNGGSNESDDSNKRLRCRGKGGKGKGGKGKGAYGKGVYGKGGEGKGGKGSDSSSDIDMDYSMSYPTGPCYKGKGKGGKGGKGQSGKGGKGQSGKGQSGKGQSGKGQSGKGGYYSDDDDDYDDDYGCECMEDDPSEDDRDDPPSDTPGIPIDLPTPPPVTPPTDSPTRRPSRSPTKAPTNTPTLIASQPPTTIDDRDDNVTGPPLPQCNVCKEGEGVANPDQLLPAPVLGVDTCGDLAVQLQFVLISEGECAILQSGLEASCCTEATSDPTLSPTSPPSPQPTIKPTSKPSPEPTTEPTSAPTTKPSPQPTAGPTFKPTSKPSASPTSEPNPACGICDGPMDQVTNPDAIVTDPVTQDLVTCQELVDLGKIGVFDEDQCSNIQNAQEIQDNCGCVPYECNICDSPMEKVANPGRPIIDPITGDMTTCGFLADLGMIGGFDESQCSVLQSTQSVQDVCGCHLPAPPELVGEWIGDYKVPGIKVGHCGRVDIDSVNSFDSISIGEGGFCRQVENNVERPLDFGTMTNHQCVPCTSRYDVFNIRDGTGPSEKYNDYTQSMASCGTFSVKASDGAADEDPFCVSYRLSTMVPKTGPAEDEIRVMTLTAGNPGGVCPAHVVFDVHHMTLVDGVYQSYQMRYEGSGEPDLSDWRCPPSDV